MKVTAFYQLSVCVAVVAAAKIVMASPASPRARAVGGSQELRSSAERHGLSIEQLGKVTDLRTGRAAEKSKPSGAKATLIPSAVAPLRHKVAAGETLGEIAERAGTTVEVLARANTLGKGQQLQVGQLLVLPSLPKSPRKSWNAYARPPKQKGFLDVSMRTSHFSGQALGSDGRLRSETVRTLNDLLGAGGAHPAMPERLVRLLVEVSDTFGGRPIRLVSGYRTTSYFEDSKHKVSSAVDFIVVGVPNAVVCEYLREIEDVGVGYYPNSSFVHLDVRDHSAYWVDYAGPGEPPRSTPDAPPPRPSRRPLRPADRKLMAALDRALEKTQRSLEAARALAPGDSPTATKPEREGQGGSSPTAQAEPESHAALDVLALSASEHDATTGSRPSEP